MEINRDNYEAFFLLYVDDELCAAGKKAVEDFTAANADLASELDMLRETLLPADYTVFANKESLLKNPVSRDALQEMMLLKTDEELRGAALQKLNDILAEDTQVAAEYALLQHARLDPAERVVFTDKDSLYRRERDNVIAGRFFWRAAAALFIGIFLFLGISHFNNTKHTENGTALLAPPPAKGNEGKTARQLAPVVIKNYPDSPVPAEAFLAPAIAKAATADKSGTGPRSIDVATTTARRNRSAGEQNGNLQLLTKNNLAGVEPLTIRSAPLTAAVSATVPQKPAVIVNPAVQANDGLALATTFRESGGNDNKILYMDEDVIQRSKAGGIFRRVKRFMERTAKIKTGADFRVAGIALSAK